ncbi:MAG: hypothetical protein DWQ07_19360 [Chloroflexi bacterium]|nr:MAG: hypothetical protein DWQ07_19360 [Chloroflexota bacterium]MBL1194241.1 hypothetical protein [Chloroflexota bacterium]NOH11534.1 hypothetical protein [Chloroflexota bacterium]
MRDPNSFTYRIESWLLWMMSTGVGWPIGVTVALAIADNLATLPRLVGLVLGGLIGGGLVAVAGWFAVRRKISGVGYWLLATAVAWPLSLLLAEFIFQNFPTLIGWFLAHALGGAVYGFVQARSFIEEDLDRNVWPLVALAAWLITAALEVWLPSDGGIAFRSQMSEAVFGLIGWPMLTVMAFFTNLLLLPKPRGKADDDGIPLWPKAEKEEEEESESALPQEN